MRFTVKTTNEGKAYLNVGCGALFASDWNNIDLFTHPDVHRYDVRRGLPYLDNVFDAVYSSHTLEHFSYHEGRVLIGEMYRVLKPGGVVRVVVPDLEQICREYLARLDDCKKDDSDINRKRYQWISLELFDQMTRGVCGGRMLEVLQNGDVDIEYIKKRNGDQFRGFYSTSAQEDAPHPTVLGLLKNKLRPIKRRVFGEDDPKKQGELHRWMYDTYSLKSVLKEYGFKDVHEEKFNTSRVDAWDRYHFDTSEFGDSARKPDSLFMEAIK